MKIYSNTGGVFATCSYLVVDEATKQAVLFDAPNDTTGPLLSIAAKNGLDLIGLWLTHGHIDHIADHAVVTGRFPKARVLVHRVGRAEAAGRRGACTRCRSRRRPGRAGWALLVGRAVACTSARTWCA